MGFGGYLAIDNLLVSGMNSAGVLGAIQLFENATNVRIGLYTTCDDTNRTKP
jgi:hypothetical protein